jgi:ankyrin repeat protein
MAALTAAIGESSGPMILSSSSPTTCTCRTEDFVPREPYFDDLMWNLDPLLNEASPPAVMPNLGRTALHRAVSKGNDAVVRMLLERGADIVRQDSYGKTALHLAVENGSEKVVKVLLEKLKDPNLTDGLGRTALFSAIQAEDELVSKLLLEAAIDVNKRDSTGDVALHIAAELGPQALILLLLTYGANIDA